MFNMIIGGSKKRNAIRIAKTMPSIFESDMSIDSTTRMRIKSMQDECKQRAIERQKYCNRLRKEDKQG